MNKGNIHTAVMAIAWTMTGERVMAWVNSVVSDTHFMGTIIPCSQETIDSYTRSDNELSK